MLSKFCKIKARPQFLGWTVKRRTRWASLLVLAALIYGIRAAHALSIYHALFDPVFVTGCWILLNSHFLRMPVLNFSNSSIRRID